MDPAPDLDIANDPYDWVAHGIEKKWITPVFCDTHDGMPHDVAERIYHDDLDYDDPCVPAVIVLVALDEYDPDSDEHEGRHD